VVNRVINLRVPWKTGDFLTRIATTSFLTVTLLGEVPMSPPIHPKHQPCVGSIDVCATSHAYLFTHPHFLTLLLNQPRRGSVHVLIRPPCPTLIHDAVYIPIHTTNCLFYALTKLLAHLFLLRYDAVSTGIYLPFFPWILIA